MTFFAVYFLMLAIIACANARGARAEAKSESEWADEWAKANARHIHAKHQLAVQARAWQAKALNYWKFARASGAEALKWKRCYDLAEACNQSLAFKNQKAEIEQLKKKKRKRLKVQT